MSAVRFIDAGGIGVLLAAARAARDAGGGLSLRSPSPWARRLIRILRLEERLPVIPPLNGHPLVRVVLSP
jgi:anti-anti-sigma factor